MEKINCNLPIDLGAWRIGHAPSARHFPSLSLVEHLLSLPLFEPAPSASVWVEGVVKARL